MVTNVVNMVHALERNADTRQSSEINVGRVLTTLPSLDILTQSQLDDLGTNEPYYFYNTDHNIDSRTNILIDTVLKYDRENEGAFSNNDGDGTTPTNIIECKSIVGKISKKAIAYSEDPTNQDGFTRSDSIPSKILLISFRFVSTSDFSFSL